MTGSVSIARSIFDHAVFADEPKTEREAWIWMIMEASWKPRKKRVGNAVVDTSRGQFAASVRFMASAWKWTAPKVQRYLKRLEKMEMIRSQADTGVTIITICNYDEYQPQQKTSDTAAIQRRYSSDTNENKGEIREEVKEDANASIADASPKSPSFDEFWSAWPLGKVGKDAARKAFGRLSPRQRIGATSQAAAWCASWRAANPRLNDIHPSTYLNNKRWEDEPQSSLTLIHGGPHDQPRPNLDRRQQAANSAFANRIAVAARARPASGGDWFDG